jgi:predicted RNA binding protein YcfA (HicA-like mRNA interferase family)
MGQFSNWTFKHVEKFLKQNNFVYVGSKGSHYFFKKEIALVVVPMHGAKAIPIGTLKSIIKQSKISKENWK